MSGDPDRQPSVSVGPYRSRRWLKNKRGRVLQSTAAVFCGRQGIAPSSRINALHWRLDLLAATVTEWAILVAAHTTATADGPELPGGVLYSIIG